MNLLLLRSLWTNGFDLDAALADCKQGPFNGIEGPLPPQPASRDVFGAKLRDAGLPFVVEIATGGSYVPESRCPERHLEDFRRKAEEAAPFGPVFLTVLGGCDAWPLAQSVSFFGEVLEITAKLGLLVCVETHRGRPTFNPWTTRDLLDQLPTLQLTCDFSHWCCVCERLVLEEEPELLAVISGRAGHIHARVGYDQGPQVPHPAASEYHGTLVTHERWWDTLWNAQELSGRAFTTMTPEFGPDGYLHSLPFTRYPVGDLKEINHWIAHRQRDRFNRRPTTLVSA